MILSPFVPLVTSSPQVWRWRITSARLFIYFFKISFITLELGRGLAICIVVLLVKDICFHLKLGQAYLLLVSKLVGCPYIMMDKADIVDEMYIRI